MSCLRMGLALLGVSLLAACAASRDDLVSEKLDGFIGMPKEALIGVFGTPTSDSIRRNGLRYVTFRQSRQTESGGYHRSIPQTENVNGLYYTRDGWLRSYSETRTTQVDGPWVPATTDHWTCLLGFGFDAGGRVASYSYGNALDCYYALRLDLYR
jgi:hypothetical protein